MQQMISVKTDIDRLTRGLTEAQRGLKDAAIRAALNRVAAMAKTGALKEITTQWNVKRSEIAPMVTLKRAEKRSAGMEAAVRAEGAIALPIHKFGVRQLKSGVSFKIKKGGRRGKLSHAFIAKMKSGKVGVFERVGKKRLPIVERFTIGIPRMLIARAIVDKLKALVRVEFPKRLEHELRYRMDRAAR